MSIKYPRGNKTRSSGMDLELFSSDRPLDKKCKYGKRPGSSASRRPKSTEYGVQMETKQAIKAYYGVLEKQFKNYYHKAGRMQGSTSDNLALLLEKRLDNVVYRMGFAPTRRAARQLVSHGHIKLRRPKAENASRVNIPSYLVESGSEIFISETAISMPTVINALQNAKKNNAFDWLEVDYDNGKGFYKENPDVSFLHNMFKFNLVVEFYSK